MYWDTYASSLCWSS